MKLVKMVASSLLALVSTTTLSAGVPGQGTWQQTLMPRDLTGDGIADAYYDNVLDITWLDHISTGAGAFTWYVATAAASDFSISGISDWRLPRTIDKLSPGGPGPDFGYLGTDTGYNVDPGTSELAYLFHVTLGNSSEVDAFGVYREELGLTNSGPFRYLKSSAWSETRVPDGYHTYSYPVAWAFDIEDGLQQVYSLQGVAHLMFVRDGDVSAVPESNTALTLLLGLAFVLGVQSKFKPRPAH